MLSDLQKISSLLLINKVKNCLPISIKHNIQCKIPRKAKGKQEMTKEQMKTSINNLIDNLNQKIEYLKQSDINEFKIIEIELQSFKIELIFYKKLPYSYCEEQCTKKSSIFEDIKWLELKDLDYYCLRCCKISHAKHFEKDYLVVYENLKKEQKIKQKLLVNQKEK
ncbi:unnamed protein product [Paramecium sonneborni]|uniref:Uncharacterized protein n=1 Tax=Paramecium sonneborni TaxID=65129 RepID=A0A8S1RKI4_9CILI|nr:unnamed protein product [Paramecium sonneborni]